MRELFNILDAVLPVFCMVGAGAALRRTSCLSGHADESLLRIIINALVPCLIFDSILGNSALHGFGTLLVAPVVGFGTVAGGIALAWYCRRWTGLQTQAQHRTFAVSAGLYNYGYVPLPLALLLYGPATAGVLFVHNVGVEIALWTVGLFLMTGASPGKEWHKVFNPPLLAVIVGVALNLMGGDNYVPGFLMKTVKLLGQCAFPLGLVLTGATIIDQAHEFLPSKSWREIGWGAALRLGILPLIFVILARYLPVSLELKRVIVLQAAMPAAVFPIVMARHYGGDAPTALRIVLSTSALSLITTPLWIRFGSLWIGLE